MELFDETLDINSTENYELSVQAGPEALFFCLLDTIRNKYVLLRTFEPEGGRPFNNDRIAEIFDTDDFLKRRFRKVHVITPSPRFTLVPAPLFDPGKKEEYFTFNHELEDGEVILSNVIDDPSAYLVFAASKQLTGFISGRFPQAHPVHHVKPLLNHISHNRKKVHGNYIHLHVEREYFNLIVFDHGTLRFCNAFNYRNITDIMYYVLNVFKTLGIGQEETIHLSGNTSKYDDLTSNLSIYIRNVKFSEPSGNFSFSYVFNDIEIHRFINLFTVVNCE